MIDDPNLRATVARQVTEPSLSFWRSLERKLERSDEPESSRVSLAKFLRQLASGIVRLLRGLIEAQEVDAFLKALREWVHEHPMTSFSDAIDDVRLQLRFASGDTKRELERELHRLEPLEAAVKDVRLARASALIQLGGWVLRQRRTQTASPEGPDFDACLEALAGAVAYDDVLAVLDDYFGIGSFDLLDRWHSQEMIEQGVSRWSGDRSGDGLLWAAVLLLRLAPSDASITVEPRSNSSWVRQQMELQIDAVLQQRETFGPVLPETDLDDHADHLKGAWRAAESRFQELERERIAVASLDVERVTEFRTKNIEAFRVSQVVATALGKAGTASRNVDDSAFESPSARVFREYMPKGWFVDDREVIGLNENLGRQMAEDQDRLLLSLLRADAAIERPGSPDDVVPFLTRLIAVWTKERGQPPLVVAPNHFQLRDLLWRSEAYERESSGSPRGRLSGTEVYLAGSDEDDAILVIDPAWTRLTEFIETGAESPLRIRVEPVDHETAMTSVEAGFSFGDRPDLTKEAAAQRLVEERVLVDARTAFELTGSLAENTAVIWREATGPVEEIE